MSEVPRSAERPLRSRAAPGGRAPGVLAHPLAPAARPRGLAGLPHGYRRAAVFSLLAALRLLTEIEDPEIDLLKAPPRLALSSRIGFLLRARWVGR